MDDQYSALVGKQIRSLRKQHRWTQEELSNRLQVAGCDLTRSALAKIEAGQRHIYPDELKALRMVLQVSYEMLLP